MKNNKEDDSNDSSRVFREVGPYLGTGLQLAVTIALMIFIGRWLDGKFNKDPLFTLIFAFLGCGIGLYNFIRTIIELGKKSNK